MILELNEPTSHFSYKNLTTVQDLILSFESFSIVINDKKYVIKSCGKLSNQRSLTRKEKWFLHRMHKKNLEDFEKIIIDEFESECTVFYNENKD